MAGCISLNRYAVTVEIRLIAERRYGELLKQLAKEPGKRNDKLPAPHGRKFWAIRCRSFAYLLICLLPPGCYSLQLLQ